MRGEDFLEKPKDNLSPLLKNHAIRLQSKHEKGMADKGVANNGSNTTGCSETVNVSYKNELK